MSLRQGVFGLLLLVMNAAAAACDLPALMVIPAAGTVDDFAGQRIGQMQRYVTGIRDYTACLQAELAAAGGDAAPASVRDVLIDRNNAAVAEARVVMDLFAERVAPVKDLYLAEFVSSEGDECIPTARLETTSVVNDMAVLFIERGGGRTHLNVLEASCPNLERYGEFEVRRNMMGSRLSGLGAIEANTLCSREFIYPFTFDRQQSTEGCGLGRFFEVTEEQAARLVEVGAANREAAAVEQQPAQPEPAVAP
jgi:hypothetical protein